MNQLWGDSCVWACMTSDFCSLLVIYFYNVNLQHLLKRSLNLCSVWTEPDRQIILDTFFRDNERTGLSSSNYDITVLFCESNYNITMLFWEYNYDITMLFWESNYNMTMLFWESNYDITMLWNLRVRTVRAGHCYCVIVCVYVRYAWMSSVRYCASFCAKSQSSASWQMCQKPNLVSKELVYIWLLNFQN